MISRLVTAETDGRGTHSHDERVWSTNNMSETRRGKDDAFSNTTRWIVDVWGTSLLFPLLTAPLIGCFIALYDCNWLFLSFPYAKEGKNNNIVYGIHLVE